MASIGEISLHLGSKMEADGFILGSGPLKMALVGLVGLPWKQKKTPNDDQLVPTPKTENSAAHVDLSIEPWARVLLRGLNGHVPHPKPPALEKLQKKRFRAPKGLLG